jgi:hypothetical protein
MIIIFAVELSSRNEENPITGFTIVTDISICQQPMGWFDHLDPAWNSTQCMQEQVIPITVIIYIELINFFIIVCTPSSEQHLPT